MANFLIVDDSRTSRRILRGILEQAGYTVIGEATNGQEAVCGPAAGYRDNGYSHAGA